MVEVTMRPKNTGRAEKVADLVDVLIDGYKTTIRKVGRRLALVIHSPEVKIMMLTEEQQRELEEYAEECRKENGGSL